MSTLVKPRIPGGSEPSRDDDLTGVRALLSSLPEPDPMPEHLVQRINASLAAEHAQRAARTSGAPVTPLLPTAQRRRTRLLFGIAGAAAALALITVVSSSLLSSSQNTTTASRAGDATTSSVSEADGRALSPKDSAAKAPTAASPPATPTVVMGQSQTRYTAADFVAQARRLGQTPVQQAVTESSSRLFAGTASGLKDCLTAIGAAGAEAVRADIAFYEGRPALVIIATRNGKPVAYAVGPTCSHADAAVLHPGTPLS